MRSFMFLNAGVPIQVVDACVTPVVEQDVTGLVVETEPDLV